MTCNGLNCQTVKQLRAICKELGINAYSVNGQRMNKADLVEWIKQHRNEEPITTKQENATLTTTSTLKADITAQVEADTKRDRLEGSHLPTLFSQLSEAHPEMTIGTFHDALRELVKEGIIRLHPFTGSWSELKDGQLCLIAAQEIKMYAEAL